MKTEFKTKVKDYKLCFLNNYYLAREATVIKQEANNTIRGFIASA